MGVMWIVGVGVGLLCGGGEGGEVERFVAVTR